MPKNIAASVHQRLLNLAREMGRPFDELLQYYGMERFLYRLSQSEYANSFVLKGALLFRVWTVPDSRATRDIDFLAYIENSTDETTKAIESIIAGDLDDDGIVFDPESLRAERIKEDADYEGVRVRFAGYLGNARIPMQIDLGFGDVVHPAAVENQYPTLLDFPAPVLRSYPPETVIAEKLEAMMYLGGLNSRMKDFFDVWRLSQRRSFDGNTLQQACQGTFDHRGTEAVRFQDLKTELLESADKQRQWAAFLKKSAVRGPESFADVLDAIEIFLSPILVAVIARNVFAGSWGPGGPWRA